MSVSSNSLYRLLARFFLGRGRKNPDELPPEEREFLSRRYAIKGFIGRGSMGRVWEGMELSTGRAVAIKQEDLESLGPQAADYYLREARIVTALKHPNIVALYDVLRSPAGLYLVFELLSGRTVQQTLAEVKRLPLDRARAVLAEVCAALEYAHAQGVVHRDLKPGNIMVTAQGEVKIMDFGVARRVDEKPAAPSGAVDWTRILIGTPAYMAPESQNGFPGPAADVYALGICLYEMLVGQPPYQGHSPYIKRDRSYTKVEAFLPKTPPEVDALIYDALESDPAKRIASAADFRVRLEAIKTQR